MEQKQEVKLPIQLEMALEQLHWIIEESYQTARVKGWWEKYDAITKVDRSLEPEILATKLMLTVGELGEAYEEIRHHHEADEIYYGPDGKPEGFPIEIADAMIRLMDLCRRFSIDLPKAMAIKMRFNRTRPHLHGGKAV